MQPTNATAFTSPPAATLTVTTSTTGTNTPSVLLSATPTPSSWATPFPPEAIFVQYGIFGGDGGNAFDYYYGRGTPSLIVYTNGLAIERIYNYSAYRFQTTQLSEAEMCDLQRGIAGPELPDYSSYSWVNRDHPLYKFDDSAFFPDGGPVDIYQLNGDPSRYLGIEVEHYKYVIPEVKEIIEFVESYTLSNTRLYLSNTTLLWIEEGSESANESTQLGEWPESLPSLESFYVASVDSTWLFGSSHVILEGSLAQEIAKLFDNEMKSMFFREKGRLFTTIHRPLLPHESPEDFSIFPGRSFAYQLPFSCSE